MPEGWARKIAKRICPICNKENKRFWRCCSKNCTTRFWKKAYGSWELRSKCFERDKFTCKKCKKKGGRWEIKQPKKEIRQRIKNLEETIANKPDKKWRKDLIEYYKDELKNWVPRVWKPSCIDEHGHTILEADHIVPIALGGDQYDLKNYQTLCSECHKAKTAKEAKKFAMARVGQKTLVD